MIGIGPRQDNPDRAFEFLDANVAHRLSRPNDIELIAKTAEELTLGRGRNQTLFCYHKYAIWRIHEIWGALFILQPNILSIYGSYLYRGNQWATENKNIVVCCDGTANEFGDINTNVVHTYDLAIKDEGQVAFYDPGVGTGGWEYDESTFVFEIPGGPGDWPRPAKEC